MDNKIVKSFKSSMNSEVIDVTVDYSELALDSFLNESLFKDIPFIRTVVSAFKIGKTVHDALYVRNLFIFLKNLKEKHIDGEEIKKHKNHFKKTKNLEKEIEYILIYCDRLVEAENVTFIANLYIALMDEKIGFDEFVLFLSVLDNLLPGDVKFLLEHTAYTTNINFVDEHFLRLAGLGLMLKTNGRLDSPSFGSHKTITTSLMDLTFTLSHFGSRFLDAIGK